MLGVVVSAAAVGFVLYLLNEAWGYGSEQLPAAQATMMKMLVEGIMNAELPWALIFIGVFVAVMAEILKVLAVLKVDSVINLSEKFGFTTPQPVSLVVFILLLIYLYTRCMKKDKK